MECENKEYHVSIAAAANDRMAEHFEFLARVSSNAANRLLAELLEDIKSLEVMPFRYPTYNRPYLPPGKYRCLISCERYRVIYQVEGTVVLVDDIQDCRQADDKSIIE